MFSPASTSFRRLGALLTLTATASAQVQFGERNPLPVDQITSGAETVDWNRDGRPDVVLATASGFQLLLNDGTGRFDSQLFPTSTGAIVLLTGDLDLDGDQDALAMGGTGRFILRNSGPNTAPVLETITAGASFVIGGALIDLDGDGDLDLIRNELFTTIVTSRNDGAGRFADDPSLLPGLTSGFVSSYIVADLNGDGADDLLVTAGLLSRLFLSSPQGFVNASGNVSNIDLGLNTSVFDLTGDGRLELVNFGDAAYAPDSTGVYQRLPILLPAQALRDAVISDLDGDGDVDIFGVNGEIVPGSPPAHVFIQGPTGTFSDETASRIPVSDGVGAVLAAADFDGDQDLDAYVGGSLINLIADRDWLFTNRDVQVETPDPVQVGGNLRVQCFRQPGYGAGVGIGLIVVGVEAATPVSFPFGTLYLDPGAVSLPFVSLPAPVGAAEVNDPVPNNPNLIGLQFAVQGLIVDLFGAELPRLTNFKRITIQ